MKNSILSSLSLLILTGQLFAQQSITKTLDLTNPTYPSTFNFIGNGYWDKTFTDVDYTWFKSQIFSFSHLIEGPVPLGTEQFGMVLPYVTVETTKITILKVG